MNINHQDEPRLFGEFTLDVRRGRLLRAGAEVKVRPKPFEVLRYLVDHSDRIVTKEELFRAVWPDAFVTDDALVQCLRDVRRALADDKQCYIRTVPRRGYIFAATVHQGSESAAAPEPSVARIDPNPPLRNRSGRVALWLGLVGACLIGVSYLWISHRTRANTADPPVKSIAVLPFKSLTATENDDLMGLGMADTLITRLTNIREIAVRPTSAIRRYSGQDQDPLAAGREQLVDAVLEGTMQLSGKRLRVRAQLVNVKTQKTLWGFQCDESCSDIFEAQDTISRRVVEALKLKLSGEESAQVGKRVTENLDAYQAYLKGRYFWERRTFEALQKSVSFFEEAIRLDPNFALAYTGLADSYVALWGRGYYPFSNAAEKIRAAASRALEIDDNLGEAHTDLACYYTLEFDFRDAELEHQRAIALSPNYPLAHMWYGFLLEVLGRDQESLVQRKRAHELDPLSLNTTLAVGTTLARLRQYDRAEEQYRKALELAPDFEVAHEHLGYLYLVEGKYSQAIDQYEKTHFYGPLGFAYALAGRRADAAKTLADLVSRSKSQYISPVHIALIHLGLGEKDKAFAWLEKGYIEHAPLLLFLKQDRTYYTSIASDPRYQDLCWRIGL